MAAEVSISHDAFVKATSQMRDVIPRIDGTARQLETTVDASKGYWSGMAQAEFTKFHQRLDTALKHLNTSLTQLTDALEAGNKHFGGSDQENAQLFSKIHTDLSTSLTNLAD